jgi:ribosomal protein L32
MQGLSSPFRNYFREARMTRRVIAITCPHCGKPRIWDRACGHCGAA